MDPQLQHAFLMDNSPRLGAMQAGERFDLWQKRARNTLGEMLGLPFFSRVDDDLCIEWTREENGVTETRMTFATEEHYRAAAHLLVPAGVTVPIPVILCLQGHSTGMHISLGRPKFPGDTETISGGDRDFARQIVARGWAALALEQRGFGECGGTPNGPDCYQSAMAALLLGRTLLGERVWDISRTIDVLTAHFPQIDAGRIAIMGNSGGGTASIYAAAMDQRIAAVMPSCAFCGYKASIGMQHHCSCNYVPGILRHFDMGDLGGLIAPRPLIIVNGAKDEIFPLESANRQYEIVQQYYAAAGASNACAHVVGAEGHRFYADLAWPEFCRLTGWKAAQSREHRTNA